LARYAGKTRGRRLEHVARRARHDSRLQVKFFCLPVKLFTGEVVDFVKLVTDFTAESQRTASNLTPSSTHILFRPKSSPVSSRT
jgi:hypothetical protein